jgi:hypothetical protein
MKISMQYWWIDGDGKPNYREQHLSQYNFVHHISQIDHPGIEPGPPH